MTGGPGCNVNETLHCPRSTDTEYRTAFASWVIAASPLIVATDIRNMTAVMKECLLNEEAIAINQDADMPAGKLVGHWRCEGEDKTLCAVMGRPLSDGSFAGLLSNLNDDHAHNITIPFLWLQRNTVHGRAPLTAATTATVRDVLNKKDLGTFTGEFTAHLNSHESVLLRITPQH